MRYSLLCVGALVTVFGLTALSAAAQPSSSCASFYQATIPPAPVRSGTPDTTVFCRSFYATAYSPNLRDPVWTSYRLTRAMADGGDRTLRYRGNFRQQEGLTAAQQGHHNDFTHTPFTRGHLVPANDAIDMPRQRDTFVVTNIVPQPGTFNSTLWRYLEASVHRLAQDEGEVYVVTGAVFQAAPTLMRRGTAQGRVAIPNLLYKAIYVPSRNIAVGYVATNESNSTCTAMSIRDLSRQTGFDPFPFLQREVKDGLPAFALPVGAGVPLPNCRPS
jgi:endonuclease G, mitochondrial